MSIPTEQKEELFSLLFPGEYEILVRIDEDGTAETISATNPVWKMTEGSTFNYESTMSHYLMDFSADSDTESVIRSTSLRWVRQSLNQEKRHEVHFAVRGRDGELYLKEAVYISGKYRTVWFTLRDITYAFRDVQKRIDMLESALREARERISEKNDFLTLMSRNIRTPLYSIMGLTRIAQENMGNNSSLDSYLHKISMSGTYMQETIDDVLDLRRIANHEIVLRPESVHLYTFLSNLQKIAEPNIEARDLIFSLDTDFGDRLKIMADVHCLRQIIIKMLQVAQNYTVRGGRVRLVARELFRSKENTTLEFFVENFGIVIDQERLKTLFRPSEYLPDSLEGDLSSMDISLIILKNYALAMGTNTITAESNEGRGTRISLTLTFPLAGEAGGSGEEGESLPDFHGLRVLMVDDNEINLEIGVKILSGKGVIVVGAANGQEAVDRYIEDEGRFDLIIMDILMPVMDGLEATRRIRGLSDIPGSKTIPIIAMTANTFQENFEESFRAGMNAHLVKPISPERLFAVIGDVLQNK